VAQENEIESELEEVKVSDAVRLEAMLSAIMF
jgi:hypothetical protein